MGGKFVDIARVRVDKAQKTKEARLLQDALEVLKKLVNNEDSLDVAKLFLEDKKVKSFEDEVDVEKYEYSISLGSNRYCFRSFSKFARKTDATKSAIRSLHSCNNHLHFKDSETGEVIKFKPKEIIVEDVLGDRRRRKDEN